MIHNYHIIYWRIDQVPSTLSLTITQGFWCPFPSTQASHSITTSIQVKPAWTCRTDRTSTKVQRVRTIHSMEEIPLWSSIPGWILAVFTVVGNGLVIFLITTRRSLRTTTNWFVLSLAVADFGVGAVYYPSRSSCSVDVGTCVAEKIAYAFGSLFVDAAAANLCALTLDRYLAIVHPLRYVTFMTKKRVALIVSAVWGAVTLISVLKSLPLIAYFSGQPSEQLSRKIAFACYTPWPVVACIFLLFATVRIFVVVRRIARQNAAVVAQLNFNHKLQHGVAFKARETSSAKMIAILVTVCLICYSWHAVESFLSMAGLIFPSFTGDVRRLLVMMNSAANPVAYAFHKREMKRELKQLVRCNGRQPLNNCSEAREAQRPIQELRPFRKLRVEPLSVLEL